MSFPFRERERGEEHAEEEELEQSLERVALRSPLLPRFGPFVRRAPPLARLGMSALYLARDASMVVRRMTSETSVELKILTEKWQLLFAGLVFQEVGKERGYISETLFTFIFLSFVLASQFLRIVTFYSTQLPGPNYHCREGSTLARLPHPQNVAEVLLINFGSTSVLPVSMKEKDSKLKEDKTKLLNGNSVDSADWILCQV
uniref:Uncharacterized protein n=1 Tax=Oryza punctata TaxID=4537 RepID=A0A0E0L0L2_ORYPU